MITLRQVRFSYEEDQEILSGLDLTVRPGEKLVIAGKSGSGKSTLLKLITGLLSPTSGKVETDGSSFGYVKQQPENQVITGSVEEEVAFGLLCRGVKRDQIQPKVAKILRDIGLAGLEKRNSNRLSGGQLQRLVFAASHVLEPETWILDEPTAYLDNDGKKLIHELLDSVSQNCSVIYVTSNPEEYELFDRLIVLHQGKIIVDDKPGVVFSNRILQKAGLSLPPSRRMEEIGESLGLSKKEKLTINEATREATTPYQLEVSSLFASRKQLFGKPAEVLKDISFQVNPGEIVAVVGKSGVGKTTLLETLAGVLKPEKGKVRWNGTPPDKLFGKIGVSFQFPEKNFFSETILEEIAYGIRNNGTGKKEAEKIAMSTLEKFELDPSIFAHKSPFETSGGQARRIALAATWAMGPSAYLLDEPTVGLDAENITLISRLLLEESEKGHPVIVAGHDYESFMTLAQRWIVLENGGIVYDGDVFGIWDDDPDKDLLTPPDFVVEFRRIFGTLEEARRLGWRLV